MMLMAFDTLIGGVLNVAFGNPLMTGIIGVVLFIIFLVAIKISFEGAFGLFMGFVHLLALGGYLDMMMLYGLLVVDGIIIAFAFLRMIGRH